MKDPSRGVLSPFLFRKLSNSNLLRQKAPNTRPFTTRLYLSTAMSSSPLTWPRLLAGGGRGQRRQHCELPPQTRRSDPGPVGTKARQLLGEDPKLAVARSPRRRRCLCPPRAGTPARSGRARSRPRPVLSRRRDFGPKPLRSIALPQRMRPRRWIALPPPPPPRVAVTTTSHRLMRSGTREGQGLAWSEGRPRWREVQSQRQCSLQRHGPSRCTATPRASTGEVAAPARQCGCEWNPHNRTIPRSSPLPYLYTKSTAPSENAEGETPSGCTQL